MHVWVSCLRCYQNKCVEHPKLNRNWFRPDKRVAAIKDVIHDHRELYKPKHYWLVWIGCLVFHCYLNQISFVAHLW